MQLYLIFTLFAMLIPYANGATRPHVWTSPRSSRRNTKKPGKNRSRLNTLTNLGKTLLGRKKNKKATPTTSDPNSSKNAIRDTLLDVGGQVAITAIGAGGMTLTSGANAVEAVAETAGEIYSSTVSLYI